MSDSYLPVGRHFPKRSGAEAGVLRVIEIVFDKSAVVGVDQIDAREIGTSLEARAPGADGDAIVANRARRAEAPALTCIARSSDVVDVPALVI